jgi:hypothetical protein
MKVSKKLGAKIQESYQMGFYRAIDSAIDAKIGRVKKDPASHNSDLERIAYNHGYKKGKEKVSQHMVITFATE